jgi:hypothetical protein
VLSNIVGNQYRRGKLFRDLCRNHGRFDIPDNRALLNRGADNNAVLGAGPEAELFWALAGDPAEAAAEPAGEDGDFGVHAVLPAEVHAGFGTDAGDKERAGAGSAVFDRDFVDSAGKKR